MRQRNDSGYEQHVMAWPTDENPDRWPFTVGPGEETDFPELLGGFTAVDEPEPVKTTRKSAAAAADQEVGEPQ